MYTNKKSLILVLFIGSVNYYSNAFALNSFLDVPQSMYLLARGGGGRGGGGGGGGRAAGAGRVAAQRAADRAAARNALDNAYGSGFYNPGVVQPVDGTTYIQNTPTTPANEPTPVIPAVNIPGVNTPIPAGVNTPVPANESTAYPHPQGEVIQNPQTVVDQLITQNLQLKLSTDRRINANNVEIITNQNVVTLTGDVSSQAQKQAIENYAKSIDGVQAVISNITVNGQ